MAEQFAEIFKSIRFPDEAIDQIVAPLKESYKEKNQYSDEEIKAQLSMNFLTKSPLKYLSNKPGSDQYELYLRGTFEEKRELLKLVHSNSKLSSGNLASKIRSPFHLMAKWASRPIMLRQLDSNQRQSG